MRVAPVSAMIRGRRSSPRARTAPASRWSSSARVAGGVRFHPGSAALAAAAAASASATDASGASAMTSSVAGFTTA